MTQLKIVNNQAPQVAPPLELAPLSTVNLAARQRMLSQRLVLLIMLAAEGRADKAQAAAQTLQLFADSQARILLAIRDKKMLPAEARLMNEVYFGEQSATGHNGVNAIVESFINLCRATLTQIGARAQMVSGASTGELALEKLVAHTDEVLAALNRATQAFDQLNSRHEARLVSQIGEIVEEIRLVAREAKVVSFNAQVIAARAGAVGREFSVVASSLSRISGEVDKLANKGLTLVKG
jgi:methyl-accepting chemotaxis protein